MSERDCAAIGVHAWIVVGETELARAGERLRGKGLIQLDDVHLLEGEACASEGKLGSGHGTDPHVTGLDTHDRRAHDARHRCYADRSRHFLACDVNGGGAIRPPRTTARGPGS